MEPDLSPSGAGPQIRAKVELNAQSESVRAHTRTNQLTYPSVTYNFG